MGMFDREIQLKDADFAQNEQAFDLHSAKYLGRVRSAQFEHEQAKAIVVAGPDRKEYVVFGVKAEQVGRMTDGELPARVKIGKDGRAEPFVRA